MRRLPAVLLALAWTLAASAAERVHGEDHDFAAPGVRILWGVAKGGSEDDTKVVLRILSPDRVYGHAALEGHDPFSKARRTLIARRAIDQRLDLETPRAGFADLPSREVHLYRDGAEPVLVVYYLGAPDTTPEFATVEALRAYFDRAETLPRRR